ncbi:MAG: TonB-dependent receptor [Gammaproteobacteria bacterium]|nr:TonB-dependent receptor [Gammaproteobacteria bacterium]
MRSESSAGAARMRLAPAAVLMACTAIAPYPSPAATGASDTGALEEVVVTARKREESLQRIPVSVSVLTGEAIDRTFADNMQDLEGMAPNVVIDTFNAFPNSASISIRGISHTEIEKSFDPAVGVIVDGVFLGTNAQAMIDNFDLQRVEVLRGPQGTLFGKNTIGGAINVIRKRPAHERSADLTYASSSFDRHEAKAAFNVPVSDALALRLSGSYAVSDGHLTNTVDGEDISGVDVATIRAAALFTPTDGFEIYLNVDHVRDRGELAGLRNENLPTQLFSLPGLLGLAPTFPGYPADTGPLDEVRTDLIGRGADYDTTGVSVEMNWDRSRYLLTSITAYRDVDEDVFNDFDTENAVAFNSRRVQAHEQFTEELRFTSQWSDRYDLVAGLYYYWADYSLDQTIDLLNDFIVCGSLPGAFASFGCTQNGGAAQTTTSWAVFAQGNVYVTERLRLTLGGRYTWEEKEFEATPITFPVGSLGSATDDESWAEFTPRAGLDFQWNDNVLLYTSYAEGFKSGGYNGRAGTVTSVGPYEPEFITTYEIGFKSEWFERRLRLNGAAFYNDYEDLQVELLRAAPGGTGQETVVENVAAAETYGFELELLARPVQALTLRGTFGVLEAKYEEFVADIGLGGVTDNSDLEMRKAPSVQYSIGASYARPFADAGTLLLDLNYRWVDELHTTTQNFDFGVRPSVGNLDAAIGLEGVSGTWKLSVFGRNLTDERYIIDALAAGPLLSFSSVNVPRVVGVQIDLHF